MLESIWFYMGLINLGILTYQDFKNKRKVNDRYNSFMIGATVFFIILNKLSFGKMALIMGFIVACSILFHALMKLGKADINSMSWLILGYTSISWIAGLILVAVLGVLTGVYKLTFRKSNDPLPFFIVIILCHGCMGALWLLW